MVPLLLAIDFLCSALRTSEPAPVDVVEDEDRVTVHHRLASQCGFTGVSILHRPHHLYGFDVRKDMVFDAKHTLILKVVLKHLQIYQETGLLKNSLIEERLKNMPWIAG